MGPCRPLRRLGRGGMGTVHEAVLLERVGDLPEGGRVALKVLRPDALADPRSRERFLREAELGAAVRHPALVRIHDVGRARAGLGELHYLLMDLVAGRTLHEEIAELGPLPEPFVRRIAFELAGGLAALHASGAVHRDVKPANVMVTPDGQVKLVDFGIAHVAGAEGSLTPSGVVLGTFYYIAPEQFLGGRVGPAADLYSLGVLVFEAATGKRPFSGDDSAALVRAHLEVVPPRPTEERPELSPFLDALTCRLLEKAPADRFASAAELAAVLEAGESSPWWRGIVATRPTRANLRGAVPGEGEVPFVARRSALQVLGAALEDADAGRGRAACVTGEAGLGKTRLLDELVRRCAGRLSRWSVLRGDPGRRPLAAALASVAGGGSLRESLARHLRGTPGLVEPLRAFLAGERAGAPHEPVHAAACALLRGLAGDRPVLMIVDGLPPHEVPLFQSLARAAADRRALLLATGAQVPAFDDGVPVAEVRLDPLGQADVGALLAVMLDSRPLAERLARRVAEHAGGNPWFVVELARELRACDDPAAPDTDGHLPLPRSLRRLLERRLDQLDERERSVLDVAAVGGERCDPDLIARVLSRSRLGVLHDLARLARARRLLRPTATGFEFTHALVRRVAAEAVPAALAVEYESLLVEALEDRDGTAGRPPEELAPDQATFVACHGMRGGTRARRRALAVARQAAAGLIAGLEFDRLRELADLVLRVPEAGPEDRFDALLWVVRAHEAAGRLAAAGERATEALELARARGDDAMIGRAHASCGRCAGLRGDVAVAVGHLEEALRLARETGEVVAVARLSGELGLQLARAGRAAHGLVACEQAVARARGSGRLSAEARARASLGLLLYEVDRHEDAARELERALELARGCAQRSVELMAMGNLGLVRVALGEHERAVRTFQEHARMAASTGYRTAELNACGNLGTLAYCLGRHDEALAQFDRVELLSRDLGLPLAARALTGRALVDAARGDLASAGASLSRAIDLARAARDLKGEVTARDRLGQLRFFEGDLAAAESQLFRALRSAREADLGRAEVHAEIGLAAVAWASGDLDGALATATRAWARGREFGTPQETAGLVLARARLLVERGSPDDEVAAADLLEGAAELVKRTGLVEPGPLPEAYLAMLGRRRPSGVSIPSGCPLVVATEAHLALFAAGGGREHLARSLEGLRRLSGHLAGERLDAFWSNNPVARAALEHERSEGDVARP